MTNRTQTRDSFIFYRSFYETISDLDDKQQLQIYKAIAELSLNDNLIPLEGISKTIFRLIEPQLKANKKRYLNGLKGGEHGLKGGRPKTENNPKITPNLTPKKPQDNPKITPNLTPNKNVNVNQNVNEECKSELINHNQNINIDFQEFWGNYPLQKTKVKGSKATSEKKYNLLREKGISKEELSNALANYQEEIKTNSWQQTKRVEFWLTKWEAYRQEDYSKELKFIESEVKKIEPLASIQVKDKNIIIKLPTFDSFRLNKEIINKNLGMLCENIGYKMQLIN